MMNLPARPRERPTLVHVVIDTPKGSRNKYKFDESLDCFRLSRIMKQFRADMEDLWNEYQFVECGY